MDLITYAQIGVSVILIALILIQERSAGGLGGLMGGGGGEGGFYQARRGFEKIVFGATIVLAILFGTLALLNLVL